MLNTIGPSQLAIKGINRQKFKDMLATANFATLMVLAGSNKDSYACLAPICGSRDRETEWKKAVFVNTLLNMANAGVPQTCWPDPCDCEGFAKCICQEDLLILTGVNTGTANDSVGYLECIKDADDNNQIIPILSKYQVDIPIGDNATEVSYATELANAQALYPGNTIRILEWNIVSDSAEGRLAEAGIDAVGQLLLWQGPKPAGESHFARVCFAVTP